MDLLWLLYDVYQKTGQWCRKTIILTASGCQRCLKKFIITAIFVSDWEICNFPIDWLCRRTTDVNTTVLSFDCVLPRNECSREPATECWTESGTAHRRAVVPCSWMQHSRRCRRTPWNSRWSSCCSSASRQHWSPRKTSESWSSDERGRSGRYSALDIEVAQARIAATKTERNKLSHLPFSRYFPAAVWWMYSAIVADCS